MEYPTLKKVEEANKEQLAYWSRFLPSPGQNFIGKENFEEKLQEELEILNLILKRFKDGGGWNPQLSKQVGWDD